MNNKKKIIGYILLLLSFIFLIRMVYTTIYSSITEFIDSREYNLKDYIITEELKPAFNKNNISVAFASDNNYVKYLSVAIVSLTDNMSKDYNYDIVILEDNIKDKNKRLLLKQIKDFKNISLRFIDINKHFDENKDVDFYLNKHFTKSIYSRLFIPNIFKNYEKVIYLDVDILIKCNLIELYNTGLGDNLIGGVAHIEFDPIFNPKGKNEGKNLENRLSKLYNIKDYSILSYINSGVILYNVANCSSQDFIKKCLNFIKSHKDATEPDQDTINGVCYRKIQYLDYGYNLLPFYVDKIEAKIVHFYCYNYKPWNINSDNELNDNEQYAYWIKTSLKSPFFSNKKTKLKELRINLMVNKIISKMYRSEELIKIYKTKIKNIENRIEFIESIE